MKQKPTDALRPIDDLLFNLIYQDKRACQELLQTVFDDPDLEVLDVTAQDTIPNLTGRGVRLDVTCKMADGSIREVEVQRADHDDHLRRIRYHASALTVRYTPKGTQFRDVIDVYIIYISEFDIFRGQKTIYHIDSVVRETSETVDDGLYRILINTAINDGTPLARMMSNFLKADFDDPMFPEMSRQMQRYKHVERGEVTVNQVLEDYVQERIKANQTKMVDRLISEERLPVDKACNYAGFASVDEFYAAKERISKLNMEDATDNPETIG